MFGYTEDISASIQEVEQKVGEEPLDPSQKGQSDYVTNRVSGLSCMHVLQDHKDAVSGLFCVKHRDKHFLVSAGWDARICIWNLQDGKLHDVFRTKDGDRTALQGQGLRSLATPKGIGGFGFRDGDKKGGHSPANLIGELAADDIITSMEFCGERNEFAYSSADKNAYIRHFSDSGDNMILKAVLQGHEGEVTQIKWNTHTQQWITGSEDRTIRIWAAHGIPCLQTINNESPVSCLCIDMANGCVMSGSPDKVIRVYDTTKKDSELVQKHLGHRDAIRSIIHIPSRHQVCSWS